MGQGASERLIILLEDGSVAYVKDNLYEGITNENVALKIEGKVEGAKNIVRILCCKTSPKEGTQVNNTGMTFIAIDKDGYFYDIGLLE